MIPFCRSYGQSRFLRPCVPPSLPRFPIRADRLDLGGWPPSCTEMKDKRYHAFVRIYARVPVGRNALMRALSGDDSDWRVV